MSKQGLLSFVLCHYFVICALIFVIELSFPIGYRTSSSFEGCEKRRNKKVSIAFLIFRSDE
jgi:hypothetical protein